MIEIWERSLAHYPTTVPRRRYRYRCHVDVLAFVFRVITITYHNVVDSVQLKLPFPAGLRVFCCCEMKTACSLMEFKRQAVFARCFVLACLPVWSWHWAISGLRFSPWSAAAAVADTTTTPCSYTPYGWSHTNLPHPPSFAFLALVEAQLGEQRAC